MSTDTTQPTNTSSGNVRKWAEFTLQYDFPATEAQAAEIAEKHLQATGVYVHEIQVLIPGIEKVSGYGTLYTWTFRADLEFQPIEQSLLVLPPTYIGPR